MRDVNNTIKLFFKNPFLFFLRQLYKLIVVFPFHAIVELYMLGVGLKKKHINKEKVPYCIFITSVIFPKKNKNVSYGGVRSVFTPEERAQQTAETISSIRKKIPNAKIVLVESGHQEYLPGEINNLADQYIYLGKKTLVRMACDSKIKSLGEAVMLLFSLKYIAWNAEYYFKISGRYFLNDEFSITEWHYQAAMFRCIRENYYSTRFYGFSSNLFPVWKKALLKGLPLNLIDYPIENTLSKFVPKKLVRHMEVLGLTGIGATSNEFTKE